MFFLFIILFIWRKASSVEITGAFFLLLFAVFVFENDKKMQKK